MSIRKHLRYGPDELDSCLIDFELDGDFNPQTIALITTESYGGVGLISKTHENLKTGSILRIKVGNLSPYKAQIKWLNELDRDVMKLGLQFLE